MVPGPAVLMVLVLVFWLGVCVFKISFDLVTCTAFTTPQFPLSLKMGVRKSLLSERGMTWYTSFGLVITAMKISHEAEICKWVKEK